MRGKLSLGSSRRWFLALLLAAVAVAIFAVAAIVRWSSAVPPTLITRLNYVPQRYQALDLAASTREAHRPKRIMHVTKEFGPAAMGGMGTVVTAMALAQAGRGHDVSIVMPFYSFLHDEAGVERSMDVVIPVRRGSRNENVTCAVSRLRWRQPAPALLEAEPGQIPSQTITVYLIGPGDRHPFRSAFRALDRHDIYSAYKPLPQEWKDQYFASAAAELIVQLSERIDVVQLHGATNAWVAHHVRQAQSARPELVVPALVYTLHDYTEEPEYSNAIGNVQPFVRDAAGLAALRRFTIDGRVYASAIGTRASEHVTIVSEELAAGIVERRFSFPLQELVVPALLDRAKRQAFHGVSNGMDFTTASRNPFVSAALVDRGMAFPNITSWAGDTALLDAKLAAKRHLVEHAPHILADVDEPLFVFVGRFMVGKGCDMFAPLVQRLARRHTGRLVALGTRNNFQHAKLRALARQHPSRFILLEDPSLQDPTTELGSWLGPVLRLAADFAFVPSYQESFGLVAAEALLFGARPLSTAAGGMREFLRDNDNASVFERPYALGELGAAGTTYAIGRRNFIAPDELRAASERLST